MSKMRLPIVALLLSLIGVSQVFAQRVIAYHQGTNNDKIQPWYWDKVTDVNYSFLQIGPSGNIGFGKDGGSDNFQLGKFTAFIADAKSNGKRIFISIGGADYDQAKHFKTISKNASTCQIFANNVVAFCEQYGLDGVDIDWEPFGNSLTYPNGLEETTPSAAQWDLLSSKMRDAVDGSSRSLELSCAVFPWEYTNGHVTTSSHGYYDQFNLMVYDFGGNEWPHHSLEVPSANVTSGGKYKGWDIEAACIDYWNVTKGLDKTKMVLGLPFYARSTKWQYQQSDFQAYRDVVGSLADAQLDSKGTQRYNGQPTIKRKTAYAIDNGLKGVMFWEWTGDETNEDWSLQLAIEQAITETGGCSKPDLGEDQNICGIEKVTLDASVSEADYNYKWFLDGVEISGKTDRTLDAVAPGVYKVEISAKAKSCTREANVTVLGTYNELPQIDDVSLCGSGTEVDATIDGYEHMDYSWTKQGGGEVSTSPKYTINDEGTYTITVSDPYGHCIDQTDDVVAAAITVDVSVNPVCKEGDEAYYSIDNPSGSYKWFDAAVGGNEITATEDHHLFRVVDGTPVYVSKLGGATDYTVGLSYDQSKAQDDFSGPRGKDCADGAGGDFEWRSKGIDDVRLYFTTHQQVTITSFYGRFAHTGDMDVVIYDGLGNEYLTETVNLEYEGEQKINVNFELPPGNYYLGTPDVKQWKEQTCGDDYDYSAMGIPDVFTINTSAAESTADWGADPFGATPNWYAGFYDIVISTGKPCPRIEVEAQVDASVCKGVSALIEEPGDKAVFDINEDVTIKAKVIDDDGGNLTKVEATVNGQTITLTNTTGDYYEGTWNTGTTEFDLKDLVVTGTSESGLVGSSDAIQVSVNNNNVAPVIDEITASSLSVVEGDEVTISWLATDGNGDVITYTLTREGNVINGASSPYTWVSNGVGDHTFEVTADDGKGGIDVASVKVTVTANNDPVISTLTTSLATVVEGDEVEVSWTATDDDGDVITYTLELDNNVIDGASNPYVWKSVGVGTHTFKLTAEDTRGGSVVKTVDVEVVANTAPIVTITSPSGNPTSLVGEKISIEFTATDDEDGALTRSDVTVEITGADNATLILDNDDFTADFTPSKAGGYTVTVIATDSKGLETEKTATFTVNDPSNDTPDIDVTAPVSGVYNDGETVTVTFTVTDETIIPVGDVTVTYAGQTHNVTESGGVYTASFNAVYGEEEISITADDTKAIGNEVVTIVVNEINVDPILSITSPSDNDEVATNSTVTISVNASDDNIETDNDIKTVTIEVTNTATNSTEVLSVTGFEPNYSADWTPTEEGTYTITAVATDRQSLSDQESITVSVSDAANVLPDVTVTIDPSSNTVSEGRDLNIGVVATDDNGIKSVIIEVDGVEVYSSSSSPVSYDWTASGLGTKTVTVIVEDNLGGITSIPNTITVTEAPDGVVIVNSPTDGESISPVTKSIDIDVDVTDASVNQVVYYIYNPGNNTAFADDFAVIDNNSSTGFDLIGWRPTLEGEYTIKIRANDASLQAVGEDVLFTVNISDIDYQREDPNTGLEDSFYFSGMTIYPVPASSNATVSVTTISSGNVTMELLDMTGALISTQSSYVSSGNTMEAGFNVEELPAGMYIVRVQMNGESVAKKLVVE